MYKKNINWKNVRHIFTNQMVNLFVKEHDIGIFVYIKPREKRIFNCHF